MKISTFFASIIGFVLLMMLIVVEPAGPIEYRIYKNENYYATLKKTTFKSEDGKVIIFEDYGSAILVRDPELPDFSIYYVSMLEVYVTVAKNVTYKCDIYGTCGKGRFLFDDMFLGELSVFKRHEIPVSDQDLIKPFPRVILTVVFYAAAFGLYKVASYNRVEQYQIINRLKFNKKNRIDEKTMYSITFHKIFSITLYIFAAVLFVTLFKFIYWI